VKIFGKPVVFEWDRGNVLKSWEKHKVSTQEAEEIFVNVPNFIFPDRKHSKEEKRYGVFGITGEGRLLTGVFTIRGKKVRIITMRDMSKKENMFFRKLLKEVEKNEQS
jgi:uncharacterized DUF497 family protein